MGNFYTSFTISSPDQARIAQAMKGRTAAVSPTFNGFTVVWDSESESQDDKVISAVGQQLAKSVGAPVLAVLNHDDDILMYWLFTPVSKVDEYNSTPGYFEGDDLPPRGGSAALLTKTIAPSAAVERLEEILMNRAYVFAFERHSELLTAMGMPIFAAAGYRHISRGDLPEGLTQHELIFTK